MEVLKAKHPYGPIIEPRPIVEEVQYLMPVEEEDVLKCLRSFPSGTGCGPSQMRAQHLLDVWQVGINDLVSNFTSVINIALSGRIPTSLAPLMAGATLIPIMKNSKSPLDIRPIAVGEIFRRLCAKCLLRLHKQEIKEFLEPLQVGVGSSNGVEAILLGLQRVLDQTPEEDPLSFLLLDFKNAFNSVHRDCFMSEVFSHFKALAPWTQFIYGCHAVLFCGDEIILSTQGVQQGDPLGPFLFALVLQPILKGIQELLESMSPLSKKNRAVGYLDDVTVVADSPVKALAALNYVKQQGPARGLVLSESKTSLHQPRVSSMPDYSWIDQFPPDMRISNFKGFQLLGGIISPHEGDHTMAAYLRVDAAGVLIANMLSQVQDPQICLLLLRSCLGMPQLNFCWRTSPPPALVEPAVCLQRHLHDALQFIVVGNGPGFGDFQLQLAGLPTKLGGLGIQMPCDSLRTAFPSAQLSSDLLQRAIFPSLGSCEDIVQPLIRDFKAFLPVEASKEVDEILIAPDNKLQHRLNSLMYSTQCDRLSLHPYLREHCADYIKEHQMLLASGQQRHSLARAWLHATPDPAVHQTMDPIQFRAVLHFHLHIPLTRADSSCNKCDHTSDRFGYHSLACCGINNRRMARHESVVEALYSLSYLAGFAPDLRAQVRCLGFRGDSIHNFRPADVLIRGDGPLLTCIDVTIPSSLCPSYRSHRLGMTVASKAAAKIKKHGEACASAHYGFQPFALDVCGLLDDGARLFLDRIASSYASRSGQPYSACVATCRRRISFALHRGLGDQLADLLLPPFKLQ
jgi:hypothetical protein